MLAAIRIASTPTVASGAVLLGHVQTLAELRTLGNSLTSPALDGRMKGTAHQFLAGQRIVMPTPALKFLHKLRSDKTVPNGPGGFTLLELMVVVVIVAILATVAGQSYKRFTRRARVQEAVALLGDIRIKQENYYQTYHRYVTTGASDSDFWPKNVDFKELKTKWGIDCTKPGDVLANPGWCALGAGYRTDEEVNFQLLVIARDPSGAGAAPPVIYVRNPNVDWWYARARADFDNDGTFSNIYLSSEMREPFMDNELE